MAQQGWYPDPGGQAKMFRYWDGAAWSDVVSPTPLPGPPPPVAPGPAATPGWDTGSTNVYGGTSFGAQPNQNAYGQYQAMAATAPKKPVTMWVTIGVIVIALALLAYLGFRLFGGPAPVDPGNTNTGGGGPTTQVCPKMATKNERADHPSDGRVYGGKLSYPKLGTPWSTVYEDDYRIPFGRDVAEQTITIHANYSPGSSWVASVMVGELYAGDGFYDPQQGSQIVNKCIFGTFYGDAKVTTEVQESKAITVDGYDGWITRTNLSFSIPNLATTSELAIVIIVKTSDMSSSIFYASIPNDAMQYLPDVEQAIANLKVTK